MKCQETQIAQKNESNYLQPALTHTATREGVRESCHARAAGIGVMCGIELLSSSDCGHLSVVRPTWSVRCHAVATITHPYMDPSCNLDGKDGIRTQSIPRNGDDAMMMQLQNAHGRSKEQAVLLKDHKSKIGYLLVKHVTLKKRGFICGNNTVSLPPIRIKWML